MYNFKSFQIFKNKILFFRLFLWEVSFFFVGHILNSSPEIIMQVKSIAKKVYLNWAYKHFFV